MRSAPGSAKPGIHRKFPIVSLIFRLHALLVSVCTKDWGGEDWKIQWGEKGQFWIVSYCWTKFFLKEVLGLLANEETNFMLNNLSS